jgi:peroxiredoxin
MCYLSYGQKDYKFKDKNSYFEYVEKKFPVDKKTIYYTSDATKTAVFTWPSYAYFIKNGKMVTLNEVAEKLDPTCSRNKLFKQISHKFLSDFLDEKNTTSEIVFKNLKTNEILNQDDKMIAIFLFSVNLKKSVPKYLKYKKQLEKLGINTIVLSMDMPYIKGIVDYSKINQIHFKQN